MKFKGKIKLSANKGTKFVDLLWSGEWDCKSNTIDYNNRQVQITDCPSTFKSAMNDCIHAQDKVHKPRKKEVK